MKTSTSLVSLIYIILLTTSLAQVQNAYMPMLADDLKTDEYWYTFLHAAANNQDYGYDLHVRRQIGGS